MKEGHEFHAEHGFTGSAGKNMRANIPGFKRGGHLKKIPMIHPGSNDDEMSDPSMPQPPAMKKGGKVGGHGHHDTHPKHDQVKYDHHGFAHHKNHK